jgi:hypothetical protein
LKFGSATSGFGLRFGTGGGGFCIGTALGGGGCCATTRPAKTIEISAMTDFIGASYRWGIANVQMSCALAISLAWVRHRQ